MDRSGSEFQDKHDLADFFDLTGVRSRGLPAHQKEAPVLDFFARPVLTTWTLLKTTTTVRQVGSAHLHRRDVVCGLQNRDGTQACEKSNIAPRHPPTLPCARGRAKRLCPPPRRGQSYVTLGPARVGTKTISRVTVGAHTCQAQSYVTLALTRVDTNGHRRGALVPTRVDPKVT